MDNAKMQLLQGLADLQEAQRPVRVFKGEYERKNPVQALKMGLMAESTVKLRAMLDALQEQNELLQAVEQNQRRILATLERMAQPRHWDFDIQRDSLDGHIVGVSADSSVDDGAS
jgi:hypothetical protein